MLYIFSDLPLLNLDFSDDSPGPSRLGPLFCQEAKVIIDGTGSDDILNGTNKADVIDGGLGDDIINSGAGADLVDGGEGDDNINAGSGDDTLIGGAGDDQLNGGGGSDVFVFNFTVSAGQTVIPFGGFDPGPDSVLSQSEFVNQYNAFLTANGIPLSDWSQNAADPVAGSDGDVASILVKTGASTQLRHYETELVIGGEPEITASEGNDTITSFQNAGPNVDRIQLNGLAGLSDDVLDALFDLELVDTNNDGFADASRLVWDAGSITLGGRTDWGTDVLDFLHDAQVDLL
jgi:Ca2+-binding RTX toxin-like protein